MIVYGFYGVGKSTCVKNDTTNLFTELDSEYIMLNDWSSFEIKKQIADLSKNHILFINGHLIDVCDQPIDIAFMPKNIDITVKRLQQRQTCNDFVAYVKESYDEILEHIQKHVTNIIYLDNDDYVTNYDAKLTKSYHQNKKGDKTLWK